jgi:hypothetical protein
VPCYLTLACITELASIRGFFAENGELLVVFGVHGFVLVGMIGSQSIGKSACKVLDYFYLEERKPWYYGRHHCKRGAKLALSELRRSTEPAAAFRSSGLGSVDLIVWYAQDRIRPQSYISILQTSKANVAKLSSPLSRAMLLRAQSCLDAQVESRHASLRKFGIS